MTIYHTVTGNVRTLAGVTPGRDVRVMVISSVPKPGVIVDNDNGRILVGDMKVDVDLSTGDFTIPNLVDYNDPGSNPFHIRYMVLISYIVTSAQGTATDATWSSGWLTVTLDGDLTDPAYLPAQFQPPEFHSDLLTQAARLLAAQIDVSQIETSDDLVEALVRNTAGAGPKTSAAVAAAVADQSFDPTDLGYDIIVVAGQSNASGYGEGYDARLDPIHSRVWQYANSGTLAGLVCIAQDPLFHQAQAPAGRIGFAMTLARLFADATKLNRRVLIVPVAHGGSGMRPQGSGVWDPDYVPGAFTQLYGNMVAQINAAMGVILDGQTAPNNRLVGVLWHQGETDAATTDAAAAYQAKLDRMVQQLRIDVPAAATVPFVVGQMVPETIPTTNYESVIDAVHIDTPRRFVLTGFAYGPTGYSQIKAGEDSVHYNAAGQRVLARRMYQAHLRALTNVAGTAPVAPTVVTLTQTGAATAVVTWPQPAGRVQDYDVQYKVGAGAWTDATRADNLIDVTQALAGLAATNVVTARVRTINDTGASAWTTTGPVTMVALPGQVVGLAAGTPTASTVPLTWTALAGATSYKLEYKKHSDPTWLVYGTVTGTAGTVTGLLAATSTDFRVSGVNAAGAGTASATVTTTTGDPLTLIEDMAVGSDPQFAYAVARRVYPGATKAFRVRRSSDNTETDIGFATGTNNVDLAALAAFVGANSGYMTKVYDQSPAGWDFAQATATKQPRIVNAGTNELENVVLTSLFDGVDDNFLDTTAGHLSWAATGGVGTITAVLRPMTGKSGPTGPVYGEVAIAGANASSHASLLCCVGTAAPIKPTALVRADDASFPVNAQINTDTSDQLRNRWTVSDGFTVRQDIDTAKGSSTSDAQPTADAVATLGQRHLGGYGTTQLFKGHLTELVRWTTVLTDAQIAAGKVNQRSYYGTP